MKSPYLLATANDALSFSLQAFLSLLVFIFPFPLHPFCPLSFAVRDKRQPLDEIVSMSFSVLQQLMTHLLENNSLEAACVMRLCLKIFWSATIYHLPSAQGRI
jgi:hypothetical protein